MRSQVLGGGSGNRSFNDLRRLDLYTMHWELLPTRGEGPEDKPDAIVGTSVSYAAAACSKSPVLARPYLATIR